MNFKLLPLRLALAVIFRLTLKLRVFNLKLNPESHESESVGQKLYTTFKPGTSIFHPDDRAFDMVNSGMVFQLLEMQNINFKISM